MSYTKKYQKQFLNGNTKVEELFKHADKEIVQLHDVVIALRCESKQQQARIKELEKASEWISKVYIATKKGTNEIDDTQCEFLKYKPRESLLNGWEWREFIIIPKPPEAKS